MQYSIVFALASAFIAVAQAPLTVNTPTGATQCQPTALSWSGGTAPYFLSIIPGGQAGAAALESFAETTTTSYTWNVDIAAGTSVTVQIRDSTGALNFSDKVTILQGTTTNCPSPGASSSAPPSASSASSSVSSASSASSSSSASRSSASAAIVSSTRASSAPSASSSGQNSGAEKIGAGFVSVVVATLFALFA